MDKPNCLVFPDNNDWIVFAPISQFSMRVNDKVAEQFRVFVDRGRPGDCQAVGDGSVCAREFRPTCVAIYVNNQCAQQCVYCYGLPSRRSQAQLDLNFCREAFEFVAQEVSQLDAVFDVYFTGTGEPTLNWRLFTSCVELVRDTQRRHAIQARLTLCTGGQVNAAQATWIAQHFDEVNISLDGPSDIQNLHRPRIDKSDSLEGPLRLAKTVRDYERKLQIKSTVTSASVKRMSEIVEFVAREIGPVELEFEMMFALPWNSSASVGSPDVQDFIKYFGHALDAGARLNVGVRHQAVTLGRLARNSAVKDRDYICLAPPNIVTAFHDLPQELEFNPALGAYGWYDSVTDKILFDHDKRRRLHQGEEPVECRDCSCRVVCSGQGSVRSRLSGSAAAIAPICEVRTGILQELLRRAVSRQTQTQEKKS